MQKISYQVTPHLGHVLIIDDDEAIRRSLSTLLTRAGYAVALFESADQFLKTPLLPKPCVILLDMRMPGTLGVDLQAQLADIGSSVPVVFASGDSRSEEIIRAMKQGAVDFLLKPFTPQNLLDVLQRAMQLAIATHQQDGQVSEVKSLLKRLTAREYEVCRWIIRGYSNQHIAELDGGAAATVKLHRARVMHKLGVEALPELIQLLQSVELTPELFAEINAPHDPD